MKSIKISRFIWTILAFVTLMLSGCGSGDGGSPSATETQTYLFYKGSIHAVDPAKPATPFAVYTSSEIHHSAYIQHGTYNPAANTITDLHNRTVVFQADEDKIYKVSTLKGGAAPKAVQLSSATDLDDIEAVAPDLSSHDNAQIVYRSYGAPSVEKVAQVSVEPEYKMVKVGMSATDTPIPAKEPLEPLYNQTSGAISGWLAFDGNTVKRYDPNFTPASAVLVVNFTNQVSFIDSTIEYVFLEVDSNLFAYHVATGVLTQLATDGLEASYLTQYTAKDGTNLYINYGGHYILKVPLNNPTAAVTLLTTPTGKYIYQIAVTDTKVVFNGYDVTGSALLAVPKAGGDPVTLDVELNGMYWGIVTKGTIVYYIKWDSTNQPTAVAQKDDGALLSSDQGAMWMGTSASTTFAAAFGFAPQYLIKATGWNSETSFAGGTLQSFDAANNKLVATLGTIPQDIDHIYSDWYWGYDQQLTSQFGATILFIGEGQKNYDVFFTNLTTNNSLIRLTNTPSIYEWVIGLPG